MEGCECKWDHIRIGVINFLKVFIFLPASVDEFFPSRTSKRPTIVFRYGATIPVFYALSVVLKVGGGYLDRSCEK
jgi:hypothetical protein